MPKRLKKQICEICKNTDSKILHKHHVIERTEKDTSHDDWNLAILCPNCHSEIHVGIIKIIGIFPSTQQPYNRTVVFEKNGISNAPEITKPYIERKEK